MPVTVPWKGFREAGPKPLARCARCQAPTHEPFETRRRCACGSNAWTSGPSMLWPPFVLGGVVSPWFLLGSIPRSAVMPPPEHDGQDCRAAAQRVGRSRGGYRPEPVSNFKEA